MTNVTAWTINAPDDKGDTLCAECKLFFEELMPVVLDMYRIRLSTAEPMPIMTDSTFT